MSPDGEFVMSASADESLRLWHCFAVDANEKQKKQQRELRRHQQQQQQPGGASARGRNVGLMTRAIR